MIGLTLEMPAPPNEIIETNFGRNLHFDTSKTLPLRRNQLPHTNKQTRNKSRTPGNLLKSMSELTDKLGL